MLDSDAPHLVTERQQHLEAVERPGPEQEVRLFHHRLMRSDLIGRRIEQPGRVGDDVKRDGTVELAARRVTAVIPSTASRHTPYPLNRRAYRRRNQIERRFCCLKNWRRVATRYDRLARNYLAGLAPAAIGSEWSV